MAASLNSIRLRAATPTDEAFLLKLYESSRGDDLRGLGWEEERISEFLKMQYEAQQRFFESEYKRANNQIILREDNLLGRLLVDRREHEIAVFILHFLPSNRIAGLAPFLLALLLEEATGSRKRF